MSFILRTLRLGQVPKAEKQALTAEGSVRVAEHLWVKLKLRHFKGPGKRANYQVRILWGALMATDERIAVWVLGRRMINAPWGRDRPRGLRIDCPKDGSLRFDFKAEDFSQKARGQVELTLYTPLARQLAARW